MHAHTYHPYLHPISPQTQYSHPSIGWKSAAVPSQKSLHWWYLINNLFTQVFFKKSNLLHEIKEMEKNKTCYTHNNNIY